MKKFRNLRLFAVMTILAVGLFGTGTGKAHANPACKDVLTANTTLDGDLDCSGILAGEFGLEVGADNIIINLNGYKINGPGIGTAGTMGIFLEGFDDVTIKNGKITRFERGVWVKDALGIRIEKLKAFKNAFSAVRVRIDSTVFLEDVHFKDNFDDAMGVSAGSHVILRNSKIEKNAGTGIFVFPDASVYVYGNKFKDNTRSAVTLWNAAGHILNNEIKNNNSFPSPGTDFGQISLVLPGEVDILIRCNKIEGGFSVEEDGTPVPDPLNDAPAPGGIGFRKGEDTGGRIEITENLIKKTPVGIYFSNSGTVPPTPHIHRNTFEKNDIGIGFRDISKSGGSTWTVDAVNNFWKSNSIDIDERGNPVTVLDTPVLDKADHCKTKGSHKGSHGDDH